MCGRTAEGDTSDRAARVLEYTSPRNATVAEELREMMRGQLLQIADPFAEQEVLWHLPILDTVQLMRGSVRRSRAGSVPSRTQSVPEDEVRRASDNALLRLVRAKRRSLYP